MKEITKRLPQNKDIEVKSRNLFKVDNKLEKDERCGAL